MVSNEQKIAAFDGIMDLIGKEAIGEWKKGSEVPERPTQCLIIASAGRHQYAYWMGYYEDCAWYAEDMQLDSKRVICWKYDDAENIVKLLKL